MRAAVRSPQRAGSLPLAATLLTLATLMWGGNFVVGRAVSSSIPPLTLNFYRWLVAAAILVPPTARQLLAHRGIIRVRWKWILVMAVTGVALFHSFVYTGLGHTTAVNASLMIAACPVVIPLVARIAHGERLTLRQALGIVASIAGVVTILGRGDLTALGRLTVSGGDLLIVAAVVVWAVYSVGLRDRPAGLPPVVMLAVVSLVGLVLQMPLYFYELATVGGFALTPTHLATLAYVGGFASVLAYLAWNRGVAEIGAVRAGPFLNLMPVFGSLLAVTFLDEQLHGYHGAGVAAIAAGLWLASRPAGRR